MTVSFFIDPHAQTIDNCYFVAAYGDMTMKEKDGKTVPYEYCDIYRFQGGKIVELSSFVIKTEARAESASGG